MNAGKQDKYRKIVLSRSIAPQESLHRLKTPGGTGSLVALEIKNEQIVMTIVDCIRDNHLMLTNAKSIMHPGNKYLPAVNGHETDASNNCICGTILGDCFT